MRRGVNHVMDYSKQCIRKLVCVSTVILSFSVIMASEPALAKESNVQREYRSEQHTVFDTKYYVQKIKNKLFPEDIPYIAKGPEIPERGYWVEEIREGVYWVTDGLAVTMFMTTGEGVIVVDAPESLGDRLLKAVAEVTSEPVTHLIYTHPHRDHIGAASLFPQEVEIIAHEITDVEVRRAEIINLPLPTITFSDHYTLSVGSQVLELDYRGSIHEPGNIFIYAPRQKVLMLVDVVMPGWVPFWNLIWAKDVGSFIEAHDQILSYDFDTFIGGHMGRLGTRRDVKTLRRHVEDLRENAAQVLREAGLGVDDMFTISDEVGTTNLYRVFNAFLDTFAEECEVRTLRKWDHRLAGADIYTRDNCKYMVQHLRLD